MGTVNAWFYKLFVNPLRASNITPWTMDVPIWAAALRPASFILQATESPPLLRMSTSLLAMSKLRYFPNSSIRFLAFVNKKTKLRYFIAFFLLYQYRSGSFYLRKLNSQTKKNCFALQKNYFIPFWFVTFSILENSGQKILFRFAKKKFSLFSDSFRFRSWGVLV